MSTLASERNQSLKKKKISKNFKTSLHQLKKNSTFKKKKKKKKLIKKYNKGHLSSHYRILSKHFHMKIHDNV